MDADGLKIKIDSKGAQQDLAVLSKMFDRTAASADRFDKTLAKTAQSTDQNLTRAAKSMKKYAQVAAHRHPPNPDAFRKATGSIQRNQNRTLKRAAIRNLTGT
jgi:hypothetical protein